MPFIKGHQPYNFWKGKIRSEETKDKIRETLKKLYSDPKSHPQYIGRIKRSGYWYIKTKDHPFSGKQHYVAEHRLIMEKIIGRFLNSHEVVHHINHIITDNRPENLELFVSPGQHTIKSHPDIFEKLKIVFKGKHFSPKTEFKTFI
jgi:hypothetical protein